MKLTNPTDNELNEAFAEHVAGWRRTGREDSTGEIWCDQNGEDLFDYGADIKTALQPNEFNFTTSADAVLPYLEKSPTKHGDFMTSACVDFASVAPHWTVIVGRGISNAGPEDLYRGDDKSLPRAAVIALLRAHGVDVEFTT